MQRFCTDKKIAKKWKKMKKILDKEYMYMYIVSIRLLNKTKKEIRK